MIRRGVIGALLACSSALASPAPVAPVAFDELFRAHASWHLPCVSGDEPLGDLVCTTSASAATGGAKRATLRCTLARDADAWDPLVSRVATRTVVATRAALWALDGDIDTSTADVLRSPPTLDARPVAGVRREYSGDRGSCCRGNTPASCTPCPRDYSGIQRVTARLDDSWCVAEQPWGTGGAPSATMMCVSRAGLMGVAAFGGDMRRTIRCGKTIDPASMEPRRPSAALTAGGKPPPSMPELAR